MTDEQIALDKHEAACEGGLIVLFLSPARSTDTVAEQPVLRSCESKELIQRFLLFIRAVSASGAEDDQFVILGKKIKYTHFCRNFVE